MTDIPVSIIACIVGFLLIASISAIGLRRINFPYTIGLVIIGIAMGFFAKKIPALAPVQMVHLTPNLILYVLLPTLIFDAAIRIDSRLLFRNLIPVMVLAAPGLVIATLITGFFVHGFSPISLGAAMVFGALISATDPVAVIALFKELGAPKRLTMLVDGESLFNDATAIVAFEIMLGLVAGGSLSGIVLFQAAAKFVAVFAGGFIVGALIGWLLIQLISLAKNDPLIEIALTTVVAYAAFITAQYYLDLSGVMAVVGAGLVVNWYGRVRFTDKTKEYINQFWEYASFAANSFIFLMLGLTEDVLSTHLGSYFTLMKVACMGIVGVLLARAIVVFVFVPILNRMPRHHRISFPYQCVMYWGGLRGALPIGLAISLPLTFPNRDTVIYLTLGVVLFTLLIQGTTVSQIIKWLKLDKLSRHDMIMRYRAILSASHNAMKKMDEIETHWNILPGHFVKESKEGLQQRIDNVESMLSNICRREKVNDYVSRETLWMLALALENQTVSHRLEEGFLSEHILRKLEHERELRMTFIRKGRVPPLTFDRPYGITAIRTYLIKHCHGHCPTFTPFQKAYDERNTELFQHAGALADIADHILNDLDHLAELSGSTEEILTECKQYFKTMSQDALSCLEKLQQEFPTLAQKLQSRAIRRTTLIAERDNIEELNKRGGIPEHIMASLISELDHMLDELNTNTPIMNTRVTGKHYL